MSQRSSDSEWSLEIFKRKTLLDSVTLEEDSERAENKQSEDLVAGDLSDQFDSLI